MTDRFFGSQPLADVTHRKHSLLAVHAAHSIDDHFDRKRRADKTRQLHLRAVAAREGAEFGCRAVRRKMRFETAANHFNLGSAGKV